MTHLSSLSSKGQVTIPQEIRARLGLRSGDRVEFVIEDGKTVIKPFHKERPSFMDWAGAFPAFDTQEERKVWFDELRGDHPGKYE